MEELRIYNNGREWRVEVPLGGVIHVITREQALELSNKLWKAVVNTIALKKDLD